MMQDRYCKCGNKLSPKNKSGKCAKCFRKDYTKQIQDECVKKWLETSYLPKSPKAYVRNYVLERQNNKCDICGMIQVWEGKPLIFILDHIDGHSTNNHESNLRMVCPNCDTQLPTYKNKNKGNGREYHRKYKQGRQRAWA